MDENQLQEFLSTSKRTMNISEHIYEDMPARYFKDYISDHYKRNDIEIKKNKNDPPDYFINIDGDTINLEVTTLVYKDILQKNSFLNTIVNCANKAFLEMKDDLSPQKLVFTPYPGDLKAEIGEESTITIPDFSSKASLNNLCDRVKSCIQEQIDDLLDGRSRSILITNNKGEIFARLNLLGNIQKSDRFQCFIFPNRIYRSNDWETEKLQKYITGKIISKSNKYDPRILKKENWWLLTCDPLCEMNLNKYVENLLKIKFPFGNFKRIFLSIDSGTSFSCVELIPK